MKKILIITYYWPPKGGVGVQRWLKLTKYLARSGYKPIVYTAKDGVVPLRDDTLLDDIDPNVHVIKKNIFEPQKIFSFFRKQTLVSDVLIKKSSNLLDKILIWIRANLFIPDSRFLWIKPSIRFLLHYLYKNPVDIIISTGPPHSMHMIALGVKKKYPHIKWIADFRDPWTGIEYFDNLPLMSFARKTHYQLEKKIISNNDLLLSVSPTWEKMFLNMGAQKTYILPNGYDNEDYAQNNFTKEQDDHSFLVGHFGLYNKLRDHSFLWEVLNKISDNNLEFSHNLKLLFAGEVHDLFINQLKNYKLDSQMNYFPYLAHSDVIKYMIKCDLLLVTQADTKSVLGRLPAKLFEYIGAKRPILAIGKKNSDLERIISQISYAWFVDIGNKELLYSTILHIYDMRASHDYINDDTSVFSREKQALKLIQLIENI